MNKKLSITQALSFGFSQYFSNFWLFIKIFLYYILLSLGVIALIGATLGLIGLILYKNPHAWLYSQEFIQAIKVSSGLQKTIIFTGMSLFMALILILSTFLWLWFNAELVRVGLLIYNNKKHANSPEKQKSISPELLNLSDTNKWRYMGARIIYALKIMLGLILFIIPGIYVSVLYYFTGFFVIDKNETIGQDAHDNTVLTNGFLLKIFLFFVIVSVLSAIIPLSYLFMFPVSVLASVHLYKQLLEIKNPEHIDSLDNIKQN